MTKNNKRDHTVQAMLKEVVAVEETYQQGTQWLDQLAEPVSKTHMRKIHKSSGT
jgi:hypothetical protein